MKSGRLIVVSLGVLAALAASGSAFARGGRGGHGGGGHGGHHHFHRGFSTGVFIGAPLYFGPRYFYPAPYSYYYPPTPPAPTYYVEQPRSGFWHYCPAANAYYPQVQTCPGGWQLVSPQPRSGY